MPKIARNGQMTPLAQGISTNGTTSALRPYEFHGLHFSIQQGREGVSDCPFCGREGKFSVNVESGKWQCFVCKTGNDKGGGNLLSFLRLLWEASDKSTNGATAVLAKNRKFVYPETLTYWGVCQSIITKNWLIPGFTAEGKLGQLYLYGKNKEGSMTLWPTPSNNELHHQIHMPSVYDHTKDFVFICEGPWDGMAIWELLRQAKLSDDGKQMLLTGNEKSSLFSKANVVAVPGCGSIGEPFKRWLGLFADKIVYLMFDSDHPRSQAGRVIPPAGLDAAKRATRILASAERPPSEIHYLNWGKDGYDPSKKSGFDVRDAVTIGSTVQDRLEPLGHILDKIVPVPADWIPGRSLAAASSGSTEMACIKCESWNDLISQWRKAMKWIDGLHRAFAGMLASIISTKARGIPLWLKVIGPPSCGKSTLCEALSINHKYVFANSTMTGFHSGYKTDKEGATDNSLIPLIMDKTLITKDGDSLLSAPNLSKILSEARDIYDRTSRAYYRHGVNRVYDAIYMTWILCGTESLRYLDSSELGERFLDFVVMEGIDRNLEDEINDRAIDEELRNIGIQTTDEAESREDEALTLAKQMTGGYVGFLRENTTELLGGVQSSFLDDYRRVCKELGTFVAYSRARPSKRQDEAEGRELSPRLVRQHLRLAVCLSAVMGKPKVDDDIIRVVTQTSLDTSRGRTLRVIKSLYDNKEGLSAGSLGVMVSEGDEKLKSYLKFLNNIGVAEYYTFKAGNSSYVRWRLTEELKYLYSNVIGGFHA